MHFAAGLAICQAAGCIGHPISPSNLSTPVGASSPPLTRPVRPLIVSSSSSSSRNLEKLHAQDD